MFLNSSYLGEAGGSRCAEAQRRVGVSGFASKGKVSFARKIDLQFMKMSQRSPFARLSGKRRACRLSGGVRSSSSFAWLSEISKFGNEREKKRKKKPENSTWRNFGAAIAGPFLKKSSINCNYIGLRQNEIAELQK